MTEPDSRERLYPRFSEAEFARRHAAVRELMRAEGLEALVVYGSSGVNRHDQADVHYLSGFLGNRNNYAVLAADGEPALYVQSFNHVPNAREASAIRTEWGGPSSALTVARHIREAVPGAGKLGYVGDVPVQSYLAWQRELPAWTLSDVTRSFRRLRLVKSREEIEWLARGAALTDEAVGHLVAQTRPGLREYELGALVEGRALASGGLPHLCYISSGPQEGAGACVPRQNLSSRTIDRGDVINTEVSVSHWGYSGQMHRPIFVGRGPNALYRDLWDTALEAYQRCVEILRVETAILHHWAPRFVAALQRRAAHRFPGGHRRHRALGGLVPPGRSARRCTRSWAQGARGWLPALRRRALHARRGVLPLRQVSVRERPRQRCGAHERRSSAATALPLLDPPGERVAIPYEGRQLYGNLRKPAGAAKPPVVVMCMGLDSAKEEMDDHENRFLARGMATLAFDGPGQGEAEYDFPICPNTRRR
jgi:Xaa-Pro aminopeptidase